jgi:hypothetical protein
MGKNASPTWESLYCSNYIFILLVILGLRKLSFLSLLLFVWHSDPVGARYTAIEHVATVLGFVVGVGFEPTRHKTKLILFTTSVLWWFDWLTFAIVFATPDFPTN